MQKPCVNTKQLLVQLKNNTLSAIEVDVLQNAYNNSFLNANTQYQWDITSQDYSDVDTISIEAKVADDSSYTTYTAPLLSSDPSGVVSALNTLGIGTFIKEEDSGSIYIISDNDKFIYGDLDIYHKDLFFIGGVYRPMNFFEAGTTNPLIPTDDAVFWFIVDSKVYTQQRFVLKDSNNVLPDVIIGSFVEYFNSNPWPLKMGNLSQGTTDYTQYDTLILQGSPDGITWMQFGSTITLDWNVQSGNPLIPTNAFAHPFYGYIDPSDDTPSVGQVSLNIAAYISPSLPLFYMGTDNWLQQVWETESYPNNFVNSYTAGSFIDSTTYDNADVQGQPIPYPGSASAEYFKSAITGDDLYYIIDGGLEYLANGYQYRFQDALAMLYPSIINPTPAIATHKF